MITTLLAIVLGQYPLPEPRLTCSLDPSVVMVFKWAEECPTHTLRFEFRDDTFRVVCIPARKLRGDARPKTE